MFYAQFVLSKKGPLAKIWLAAHWEKKLTKAQVFETDVANAVDAILEPKVKMALRTTGHLLLGIVRIYSRKAKYLLADCNEAFLKIKMAFRPGQVDLPEDGREAQTNAINLPEVFTDFDAALPDFGDFDNMNSMAMNQSRIDDITMKEDLPARTALSDYGFGGFGGDEFGDEGVMGDGDLDGLGTSSIHMRDASNASFPNIMTALPETSSRLSALGDLDAPIPDDFGGQFDDNIFMDDIFNEEALRDIEMDTDEAPGQDAATLLGEGAPTVQGEESFALDPLDATVIQGLTEKYKGGKRKRKLIIDEVKNIPGDEMKQQLHEWNDIVRPSVLLAPPTKRLMFYDGWTTEKILSQAGRVLLAHKDIGKIYSCNIQPSAAYEEEEQKAKSALLDELELPTDAFSPIQPVITAPENGLAALEAGSHLPEPIADDLETRVPSVSPPPPAEDDQPPRTPSPAEDSPGKKKRKSKAEREASRLEESLEDDGIEGEEKKFTKRTQAVLSVINKQLTDKDSVTFLEVCGRATRKSAAAKFYTLLALKKWQQVEVDQAEPFGDIVITAGTNTGPIPA